MELEEQFKHFEFQSRAKVGCWDGLEAFSIQWKLLSYKDSSKGETVSDKLHTSRLLLQTLTKTRIAFQIFFSPFQLFFYIKVVSRLKVLACFVPTSK